MNFCNAFITSGSEHFPVVHSVTKSVTGYLLPYPLLRPTVEYFPSVWFSVVIFKCETYLFVLQSEMKELCFALVETLSSWFPGVFTPKSIPKEIGVA